MQGRGRGLSALSRQEAAGGLVAKRGDEFKRRLQEGAHGGLIGDPLFGLGRRCENAAAMLGRAINDASVDQMEQDGQTAAERNPRPVIRSTQIVFQVQADVAERLLIKRV